jgi:hypothetical protein
MQEPLHEGKVLHCTCTFARRTYQETVDMASNKPCESTSCLYFVHHMTAKLNTVITNADSRDCVYLMINNNLEDPSIPWNMESPPCFLRTRLWF